MNPADIGPGEEDIFISDCGFLGGLSQAVYCGKIIARGTDLEVRQQVRDWMEEQQFWPSVWYVSDHGNIHPTTLD